VGYSIDKKGNRVDHSITNEIELYSLAVEYDVTLFEKLGLVAGYSHHWQKKDEGADDDDGSYLLGLSYDLTQTTRLRTSYARKIRFASLRNLYDITEGNSELTTETSDNFEAGITQELPWEMTADLAFFLNNVENYIVKKTDPITGNDKYQNDDEYQFKGVEATIAKTFLETGLIRLGYSYLDATDESAGSLVDELEYRPKHKITLDANYTFDFGLTAYASFMYLKDQYIYNTNYIQGKLDDFSIVDVKLEQNLLKNMWFVYAGVDNLFDENYEESYGFPQAGRTAYVGMRVKF